MAHFKSIGTILICSISTVVVCIIIASVYFLGKNTLDVNMKMQLGNMEQLSTAIGKDISEFVHEVKGLTQTISKQQSIRDVLMGKQNPDAAKLMYEMATKIPGLWSVLVFDTNGVAAQGSTRDGMNLAGYNTKNKQYYSWALAINTDDVVVKDDIFRSNEGANLLFCLMQRVKDESGKLLGWVMLVPDWTTITDQIFKTTKVGKSGYGYMYDRDGRIITHPKSKDLLLTKGSAPELFDRIRGHESGNFSYEYQGENKILSYYTMPETGWIVVLTAYESDLAEGAKKQQNMMIIGGIAVILLIVGICMVMLRKLVVVPINGLVHYATKVAEGDLGAQLESTYHHEFKSLADQIQSMVAELKAKLGFSDGVLRGMTIPCTIIGADRKIVWVNKEACELCDVNKNPDQCLGLTAGDFFYGDSTHDNIAEKSVNTEKEINVEVDHTFPSGKKAILHVNSLPFYDMDGTLLGAVTYLIDLTEIRTQQRQIQEQNEKISKAAGEAEAISQHLSTAAEELSAQVEQASKGAVSQRDRMGGNRHRHEPDECLGSGSRTQCRGRSQGHRGCPPGSAAGCF